MPLEGGAPREILEGVREADWSPDGSNLAIIRDVNGKDRLEFPVGRVLARRRVPLDPRFSPNGDRIAFFEHPIKYDDRGLVAVVDLAGKKTVLSEGYWGEEGLAWSPEGTRCCSRRSTAYFRSTRSRSRAPPGRARERRRADDPGRLARRALARLAGRFCIARCSASAPGEKSERDLSWLDISVFPILSATERRSSSPSRASRRRPYYAVCLRKPTGRRSSGWARDGAAISRRTVSVLRRRPDFASTAPALPHGPGRAAKAGARRPRELRTAAGSGTAKRVLACGHEPGHASRCYVQQSPAASPGP